MPRLAQSEVVERFTMCTQKRFDHRAAPKMCAMRAPGCNDLIRPTAGIENRAIIGRSDRIVRRFHVAWIGIAPCKYVSNREAAKAKRTRAPLASLNGGIVLHFRRCRGIEHDEMDALCIGVPNAAEGIAIPLAIGIDRRRGRIALGMGSGNHAPFMPETVRAANRLKAAI